MKTLFNVRARTRNIGNDLIAISEEPNVRIMETKGLLCNVLLGRREANAGALETLHSVKEAAL